jgi:hypothetical protein
MQIDELDLIYFFEEEVMKDKKDGEIWFLKKKIDYGYFELELDILRRTVSIKLFFSQKNELFFNKNKVEKIELLKEKQEKIRIFFTAGNIKEFLEIKKNPFQLDYHSFM